tara:strand:+ start:239 stop:880 length:642 start_codon:yes stop_codon:yes gene_type:complete
MEDLTKNHVNSQESFWEGSFGDFYIERNNSLELESSNLFFFSNILSKLNEEIKSVCEFGANIGLNLEVIKKLFPKCKTCGVEINKKAYEELIERSSIDDAIHSSIFDVKLGSDCFDLSFTKGVLIHLNPLLLQKAYKILYDTSKKYILLAEYYNPVPVEIEYRGFKNKLFKRDFAGEMLAKYPTLQLKDYGFSYNKDPISPQDDITWFLLEKK